jgi:hypothetical protein
MRSENFAARLRSSNRNSGRQLLCGYRKEFPMARPNLIIRMKIPQSGCEIAAIAKAAVLHSANPNIVSVGL